GDVTALDRYRATRQDLGSAQSKLAKQLKVQRAALASVQAEQKAAVTELNRLAAQQRALDAKRAQQEAASRAAGASRPSAPPAAAAPNAPPPPVAVKGSWVCPVQGPHSFTDD